MAISQDIRIQDINFAFHAGLYTGNGVVVEDYHKLDDPRFLPALKEAVKLHQFWAAAVEIENYASCYSKQYSDAQLKNHMYGCNESHLEAIAEAYVLAEQQDVFEITDDMYRYVQFVMNEIGRRESKTLKEKQKIEKAKEKRPGFVYLIQSPTGYYKIGRTINPDNRLKTFTVKLPFEVEYVCVIKTENMFDLEKELHGYFQHKRVNGEWFDLKPHDIEFIKGLAK